MIIEIVLLLINCLLLFDRNESQLQMIAMEMFVETKVHTLWFFEEHKYIYYHVPKVSLLHSCTLIKYATNDNQTTFEY